MDHLAVVLLGSNLGDRYKNLDDAASFLQGIAMQIEHTSSTYDSSAWGKTDQPDFLNRVISIKTDLIPTDLLGRLLDIENKMKRERSEKWGPRTIDLDILFYDDLVYADEELHIPHPGIATRRFTLIPLCELYPDFIHPVYQVSLLHLLDKCEDRGRVQLYSKPN